MYSTVEMNLGLIIQSYYNTHKFVAGRTYWSSISLVVHVKERLIVFLMVFRRSNWKCTSKSACSPSVPLDWVYESDPHAALQVHSVVYFRLHFEMNSLKKTIFQDFENLNETTRSPYTETIIVFNSGVFQYIQKAVQAGIMLFFKVNVIRVNGFLVSGIGYQNW